MKYETGQADDWKRPDGGKGIESFLSEAVSATGASAACFYVLSGESLLRKLQFPDHSTFFEERIDLSADSVASRCMQAGMDLCEPCSLTTKEHPGMEYGIPLFSGGETAGAFVLHDVDTGMPGWNGIIRLLKTTAGLVMLPSLGHSDVEAVHEGNRELSVFLTRRDRSPAKNSLYFLAEWLMSKFNLASVSLFTRLPGELQNICIAGTQREYESIEDAVSLSLQEWRVIRKTISAPSTRDNISISIVPAGRKNGSVAAVLEFKTVHNSKAEDAASNSFSAALEIIEHEFNSYVFWADVIEAIDDSVLLFMRRRGSNTGEVIGGIFESLVSKRYLDGFSLLSGQDMSGVSGGREKGKRDGLTVAEVEACRSALLTSGVTAVPGKSSSLAMPVADGKGNEFVVILRLGWPVVLPSELAVWSRMSSVFCILLRTFTSRMTDRELIERNAQIESSMERLSEVYASMFNAQSALEVVAAINGFVRRLNETMSAAYYEEGNNFHRLDDGDGARLAISSSLLESMIGSSRTIARHIHQINYSSFSDVLSKLFPGCEGKAFYVMTAENGNASYQCFVIFAMPPLPSHKETLSHTLIELSLYFNLKTTLLGELLAAKTNSRLIDYVRELLGMISQAENTGKILKKVVDASSAITSSPIAALAVHNLASGRETFGLSIGFKRLSETGDAASMYRGIVGRVLRSGEPEIVNDYPNDPDALEEHVLTNNIERMACIPVTIGIKEKGYIAVMNTDERRYSQRHVNSLVTLSNLASLAIRLNGAKMEKAQLLSDFDLLHDAEIALFSSHSMYALQRTLAMETKMLVSATDVVLVSSIGGTKRTVCSTSLDIEEGSVVYDGSIIGMQFDHQEHVTRIVETARMEEEWASRLNMKEVLMVKVRAADSLVIVAYNKSAGGSFDENDAYKVAKLSRIATAAIDKVHLVERLNRQLKQIETMHTIVNGVIQGRAEEELMKETMPKVVEMIDGDFGLLWKHNRERNKHVVIGEFYRTQETEHLIGQEFDAGKGITGMVFRTRKPLLVVNAATDNFAVQIEGTRKQAFETIISTPLMVHDEMLGVLSVYRNNPPSFGTFELNLLTNLSNDISLFMAKYSRSAKNIAVTGGETKGQS